MDVVKQQRASACNSLFTEWPSSNSAIAKKIQEFNAANCTHLTSYGNFPPSTKLTEINWNGIEFINRSDQRCAPLRSNHGTVRIAANIRRHPAWARDVIWRWFCPGPFFPRCCPWFPAQCKLSLSLAAGFLQNWKGFCETDFRQNP